MTICFKKFLRANLADDPDIETFDGKLSVTSSVNHIQTEAKVTAQIKLSLMPFMGMPSEIKIKSAAYEATNSLEVAMVLDNTGSMGASRMQALRAAANALTDILENIKSPARNVKAALVPFVAAVNVKGDGYKESWIDKDGNAPYNGANFEMKTKDKRYNHLDLFKQLKVDWKGCVEARPAPYNLADTPPDAKQPGNAVRSVFCSRQSRLSREIAELVDALEQFISWRHDRQLSAGQAERNQALLRELGGHLHPRGGTAHYRPELCLPDSHRAAHR